MYLQKWAFDRLHLHLEHVCVFFHKEKHWHKLPYILRLKHLGMEHVNNCLQFDEFGNNPKITKHSRPATVFFEDMVSGTTRCQETCFFL